MIDPRIQIAIYALRDPRTNEVRYVGQARRPKVRFRQHLEDAGGDGCRAQWLGELQSLGLEPSMEILERVELKDATTAERKWLMYWRQAGAALLNENEPAFVRRSAWIAAAEKQIEWLRVESRPEFMQTVAFKDTDVKTNVAGAERPDPGRSVREIVEMMGGETFYISDDFCRLVEVAADSLPPDTIYEPELVTSRVATCWLERPILISDEDRIVRAPFVDELQREQDELAAEAGGLSPDQKARNAERLRVGRTASRTMRLEALGWVLDDEHQLTIEAFEDGASYIPDQYSCPIPVAGSRDLPPGTPLGRALIKTISPSGEYRDVPAQKFTRFFYALFLLLNQRVLGVRDESLDRAARRRMARLGRDDIVVRVVTLRKTEDFSGSNASHRDVEWTCRWMVRGFWRSQFFPKSGVHRPVWIWPYVKGPADKPFKETVRVFVGAR